MHNNYTYRIISLTMALLMLLTSTGLSIDMHFCGNHLRSFNLFGKAKNCFELAALQAHCKNHITATQPTKPDCEMSKKDCCHNKTLSLKTDLTADANNGDFLISPQLQDFVVAFVLVFFENRPTETNAFSFAHYKPPLIPRDIPVLVQSFLL